MPQLEAVMTTANTPADEAIAHLTARGFTHNPHMNWYEHRWARVAILDAEAACFDVCVFTRDPYGLLAWRAQLTHAPLAIFAATVTAAID
ncbi:hypothetical protein [Amycolatopsis sp. NPDC059657]|uniref:hypothetical protein n=1 Tax=Amycolatopsis sp. NPDC059657 TaxID=3346899 RepID=UPI003672ECB3